MRKVASPLDEAFSDPVRAKEMYFHRCALAHEREDELRQRLEHAEAALRQIHRSADSMDIRLMARAALAGEENER